MTPRPKRDLWKRVLAYMANVPEADRETIAQALGEDRERIGNCVNLQLGRGRMESLRQTGPGIPGLYRITEEGMRWVLASPEGRMSDSCPGTRPRPLSGLSGQGSTAFSHWGQHDDARRVRGARA